MHKQVNYQKLKYTTSKRSTLGNMACAEIGKMNGIVFTAPLSEMKCLIICIRDQDWKLAF